VTEFNSWEYIEKKNEITIFSGQFFETTPNLQTVFKNKAYIKSCVKKTKKIVELTLMIISKKLNYHINT
jgi:hypothetical protein